MSDERPAEPTGEGLSRGGVLLGVGVAVLLAFAAVVWNAYQRGTRERDAPPLITAGASPWRERPADPGGAVTPHQDMDVFTRMNGGESDEAPLRMAEARPGSAATPGEADIAGPPEGAPEVAVEDPVEPPAQAAASEADAIASPIQTLEGEVDAAPAEGAVDESIEPVRLASLTPAPRLRPAEPAAGSSSEGAPEGVGGPAAIPTEPAQAAEAVVGGDWVVQIASYRSHASALDGWALLRARHADMVRERGPDIQEADLGDRGTHWRLRVDGFLDRSRATAFCDLLQARDQDCLVVHR